jgi:two-component system response regulator HydG
MNDQRPFDLAERLEHLVERLERLPGLRNPEGLVLRDGPKLEFQMQDPPTLDELEQQYILFVLRYCGSNKTQAAEILGVDPSTLYRKLTRLRRGDGADDAGSP